MKEPDSSVAGVVAYYNQFEESNRLADHWGQIEFSRTQQLISRHLQTPPAVILDIGGAAGRYACWLAAMGFDVHLIDPVPRHIRKAQEASNGQPDAPLASCTIGDARKLEIDDAFADAVLMMGPLYHLTESEERAKALSEAFRVLKPGGLLFAAGISRFASTIDGLASGYYRDSVFRQIMVRDLIDGQHRNPTGKPEYFTDTFFHHPDELRNETAYAGFDLVGLFAVEGISYMMQDLESAWNDPVYRKFLLDIIATTEQEASLLGASPHILCVAVKP